MTINENIKSLRLQKRLSQECLGELLGVSAQAVSKWETGTTFPDISLLPLIADCFGVTIDSLFEGMPKRRFYGYGGKRQELFAIYESSKGTDEDFKRAFDAYSEVILSGKAGAEDYLYFGMLHKIRAYRDIEKALYYYRKSITEGKDKQDLQWMAAHQTLTNLLADLGRIEEAVALRLAPKDVYVLTAAGDLCAKLGRHDEAIAYWDSVPKDSSSISHLFAKAELLAGIGKKEGAIKQYEEIMEWLEVHGYNMELEGVYPCRRIEELKSNDE